MDLEDLGYVKRTVRFDNVDVHPTEKALMVTYTVRAAVVGETGKYMACDNKECQKIVRLNNIDKTSDCTALASEVISKCIIDKKPVIPQHKTDDVERMLKFLIARKAVKPSDSLRQAGPASAGKHVQKVGNLDLGVDGVFVEETAFLIHLDSYISMLYEESTDEKVSPEKIQGAKMILQLAQNTDNLQDFLDNDTLLTALARVVKDDWRKSTELATCILYVFYCFSAYPQMQSVVLHFKIGALSMQILEFECTKYESWREDLEAKMGVSKRSYDEALKVFSERVEKQERLLVVCLHILLNLAEDVAVEYKMSNKNIVAILARIIDRDNSGGGGQGASLCLASVKMLRKLSVHIENIIAINKTHIVPALAKHIWSADTTLLQMILRLLKNLAFYPNLRLKMVRAGLVGKLVPLLSGPEKNTALTVMYQMSMVDDCKADFPLVSNAIPELLKEVTTCEEDKISVELAALLVNLACDEKCASALSQKRNLRELMKRAVKYKDTSVLKVLRNVAVHESCRSAFIQHIGVLIEEIQNENNEPDYTVEVVGTLANLSIPELEYNILLDDYELTAWLKAKLGVAGMDAVGADLVLEVVILLGTIAQDEQAAVSLYEAGILDDLARVLAAQQDDDEFVCQIVYVYYVLASHQATRESLRKSAKIGEFLMTLLQDENDVVQRVCCNTLELLAESDETMKKRMQLERFQRHNSKWLEVMQHETSGGGQNKRPPQIRESLLQSEERTFGTVLDVNTIDQDDDSSSK